MKRNILSVLLACLMIVSLAFLTGCSNELETKYNDLSANQEKVEASIKDHTAKTEAEIQAAAKKATEDLAVAQATLEKLIADGKAASAAELDAAVRDFNAAIEAVEEALADASLTLGAELEASFAEELKSAIDTAEKALAEASKKSIEDLKSELAEIIASGDAATSEDLKAAIADAVAKLAAIDETLAQTAVDGDATLKGELLDAIDEAKVEIYAFLAEMQADLDERFDEVQDDLDNSLKDDEWETATAAVIVAYKALADSYYAIDFNAYYPAQQDEITEAYEIVYITLIRTTSVAEYETVEDFANDIVETFEDMVDLVETKAEYIESVLTELGGYEDIEWTTEWNENITEAEELIEAELVDGVVPEWLEEVKELTDDFRERYEDLAGAADGNAILDRMIAVNAVAVDFSNEAYKNEVASVKDAYEAWAADEANNAIHDEIFAEDVLATFYERVDRIADLATAAVLAEGFNASMKDLLAAIKVTSVSNDNAKKFVELTAAIDEENGWIDVYFSAPYDVEKVEGNYNWNMLDHALWADVKTAYNDALTLFEKNAHPYIYAVENLGDVSLFTLDEINHAKDMYKVLVNAPELTVYAVIFQERFGKSAAQTYNDLLATETEYKALVAKALSDYETAFEGVKDMTPENVTIYDEDAIDAILDWYEANTAKNADGAPEFVNYLINKLGAEEPIISGEGYVLAEDLTITAADYAEIVAIEAAFDALTEAKEAETEAVEAAIDAIAAILTNKELPASTACKDAIEAAEKALADWKSGANAPEGFAAAQFAIDAESDLYVVDEEALEEAREYYDYLMEIVAEIQTAIKELPDYKYSYDIKDDATRDAFEAAIAEIRKAITDFAPLNDNIPADVNFDLAKLAQGDLAIARYDAYVKTKAAHDAALEKAEIELADDTAALNAIGDALGIILTDHVAEINLAPTVEECNAGLTLAVAKYTVAGDITAAYLRVYAVMDEDELALFVNEAAKADAKNRLVTALVNAFEFHIYDETDPDFTNELIIIEVEEFRAPYNTLAEQAEVEVAW